MPDNNNNSFGQNAATDIILDVAMGIVDPAAIATDILLDQLIDSLVSHYSQATEEVQSKANKYFKNFDAKDKAKRADLASGKITKKEYQTWRLNQMLTGKKWEDLKDTLAEDLSHSNQIAADIINGHKSTAYALNHNYGTFQIENGVQANTSYVLYDEDTVERLIAKNPDILPKTKINIPKDKAWNKKKITSAITQGVLQGESIPDLAKRLQSVVGMNYNSAVRNARTAMTGAQSAGREDAYRRAKDMGINVRQKWLATLDGRTRHSHRMLDGETIDIDDVFSNKCRFPGDPHGPAWEVYNCRCTLVPVLKGFERPDDWKQAHFDYEEWKKGGDGSFQKWLEDQAAPDSAIKNVWADKKMSQIYNLIKSQNTTDANKFYKELGKLGKPSDVWEKYLTGQLDAEDMKAFEGILKKYLPEQNVSMGNLFMGKSKTFSTWDEFVDAFSKNPNNAAWLSEKAKVPASIKNNIMSESATSQYFDVKKKLKAGELTNEDFLKYKLQKYGGDEYKKLKNDPTLLKMFDGLSDDMKISGSDIYRGMNMSQADIDKLLKSNTIDMKGISSWSLSENEAVGFAVSGHKKAVMLKDASGQMHDGLNIDFVKSKYLQDEKEVLLSPNEKWKITGSHYEHKKYTNNFGHVTEDDVLIIDVVPVSNTSITPTFTDKVAKEAQDSLDKLKLGAGNPMTVAEADGGKANPLFNNADYATKTNCQTSAYAYECRMQGYDVVALPKYEGVNGFDDIVKTQKALGVDQSVGWINKTTGKHPEKLLEHAEDATIPKAITYQELNDLVGKNGERYTLSLRLEQGSHTVNIDRDANGALRIIDNQLGPMNKNTWTGKGVLDFLDDYEVKNVKALYRVDDCVPDATVFNKVVTDSNNIKNVTPFNQLGTVEKETVDDIAKKIGTDSESLYNKWKLGLIDNNELDDLYGIKKATSTVTPKPSTAAPVVVPKESTIDTGLIKDKKVTQIYNELKDDVSSKEANAFYKELKDIGAKDGLKQGDVWKKYLNGELDADDVAKIESHLGKYKTADKTADKVDDLAEIKKALPDKVDDALDFDAYKNKKMSAVYKELKEEDTKLGNTFYNELKKMGKPSEVWDDYLNGAISAENQKKIEDILSKKYNKNATKAAAKVDTNADKIAELEEKLKKYEEYEQQMSGMNGKSFVFEKNGKKVNMYNIEDVDYAMAQGFVPADAEAKEFVKWTKGVKKEDLEQEISALKLKDKAAAKAADKSKDLAEAQEKLKKAQDELAKLPNPTYKGIWKDDVTLADYEAKKGTIAAKKIYYDDELDKLLNDPDYKHWLSDVDKQQKIQELHKLKSDLDDFEQKGKEYAKAKNAVDAAKKDVKALQPTTSSGKFNPDDYSDAAKKSAKSFDSAKKADKYHREYLDGIWDDLDDNEKYGIWEYTRNSNPMNKSLSGYHDDWSRSSFIGYDKTDWGHEDPWRSVPSSGDFSKFGKNGKNGGNVDYHKAITDTTTAIEKSALPENTYLVRGSDNSGLAGLIEGGGLMSFDDAKKLLNSGNISDIKAAFEGQVIKNHAFTSTGIAKGTGFGGSVKYEIYAPAGTRGIYAEPQSYFGNTSSNRLYKVGQKYGSVGGEAEVILQRGTEFRITEIEESGHNGIIVKMEVTNQPDYFKYGDEDTFNDGATRHKK